MTVRVKLWPGTREFTCDWWEIREGGVLVLGRGDWGPSRFATHAWSVPYWTEIDVVTP